MSFVATKVCLLWQNFCCNKHDFVMNKTYFCCDKHVFVTAKHVFCCDKSMLVMLKLLLQKAYFCHVFVMTKVFLRQKWYLWQLTTMLVPLQLTTDVSLSTLLPPPHHPLHPPTPPHPPTPKWQKWSEYWLKVINGKRSHHQQKPTES